MSNFEEIRQRYGLKEVRIATWRDPRESTLPIRGGPRPSMVSAAGAGAAYAPSPYRVKYKMPKPVDGEKPAASKTASPEYKVKYKLPQATEDEESEDENDGEEQAQDAPQEAQAVDNDAAHDIGAAVADDEPTTEHMEDVMVISEASLDAVEEPVHADDGLAPKEDLLVSAAPPPAPSPPPPEPHSIEESEEDTTEAVKVVMETEDATQASDVPDSEVVVVLDDQTAEAPTTQVVDAHDGTSAEIIDIAPVTEGLEDQIDRKVSFAPGTPEPKPTARKKKSAKGSKSKSKKKLTMPTDLPPDEIVAVIDESPAPSEPAPLKEQTDGATEIIVEVITSPNDQPEVQAEATAVLTISQAADEVVVDELTPAKHENDAKIDDVPTDEAAAIAEATHTVEVPVEPSQPPEPAFSKTENNNGSSKSASKEKAKSKKKASKSKANTDTTKGLGIDLAPPPPIPLDLLMNAEVPEPASQIAIVDVLPTSADEDAEQLRGEGPKTLADEVEEQVPEPTDDIVLEAGSAADEVHLASLEGSFEEVLKADNTPEEAGNTNHEEAGPVEAVSGKVVPAEAGPSNELEGLSSAVESVDESIEPIEVETAERADIPDTVVEVATSHAEGLPDISTSLSDDGDASARDESADDGTTGSDSAAGSDGKDAETDALQRASLTVDDAPGAENLSPDAAPEQDEIDDEGIMAEQPEAEAQEKQAADGQVREIDQGPDGSEGHDENGSIEEFHEVDVSAPPEDEGAGDSPPAAAVIVVDDVSAHSSEVTGPAGSEEDTENASESGDPDGHKPEAEAEDGETETEQTAITESPSIGEDAALSEHEAAERSMVDAKETASNNDVDEASGKAGDLADNAAPAEVPADDTHQASADDAAVEAGPQDESQLEDIESATNVSKEPPEVAAEAETTPPPAEDEKPTELHNAVSEDSVPAPLATEAAVETEPTPPRAPPSPTLSKGSATHKTHADHWQRPHRTKVGGSSSSKPNGQLVKDSKGLHTSRPKQHRPSRRSSSITAEDERRRREARKAKDDARWLEEERRRVEDEERRAIRHAARREARRVFAEEEMARIVREEARKAREGGEKRRRRDSAREEVLDEQQRPAESRESRRDKDRRILQEMYVRPPPLVKAATFNGGEEPTSSRSRKSPTSPLLFFRTTTAPTGEEQEPQRRRRRRESTTSSASRPTLSSSTTRRDDKRSTEETAREQPTMQEPGSAGSAGKPSSSSSRRRHHSHRDGDDSSRPKSSRRRESESGSAQQSSSNVKRDGLEKERADRRGGRSAAAASVEVKPLRSLLGALFR